MRRFRFRLQTVLEWRRTRLEIEEAKLEGLHGELRNLEAAAAALLRERDEAETLVLGRDRATPEDLSALESYRRHVIRKKEQFASEGRNLEERLAAQRRAVTEAERDLRLLERLKDRRLADWTAEAAREQEAVTSEAFLARWHREH